MIVAKRFIAGLLVIIAATNVRASAACAEDYPTHPVRIIIGFGAGAAADTPARLLAQKFGDAFGQQFVVENKPGASSNLAAAYVAHANSDGYTLLMATSAQTNYAAITIDPAYNVQKDFAPIIRVASVPNILVAHPSLGVDNLRQLIALAKQKPNQIFYGSSGVGTTTHIAGELINIMAGIRLVDVPYPGSAQALTDVLAGRIQLWIAPASAVIQQIGKGELRRWRPRPRNAPASRRMFPPWLRRDCPATISVSGSVCLRRPARRAQSSRSLHASPTAHSKTTAWPNNCGKSASIRLAARLTNSPAISRPK